MKLSRRDALRTGGGLLATAGLAGCIQQRVTRRQTRMETSTNWALNPSVDRALSEAEFENYTEEMADRYGDSGVWGQEAERADDFETAYVQRLAISRETPGQPGGSQSSLIPGDVDPDAPMIIADASVSIYEVGDNRYRYWLWTAADGDDGRLLRDVEVSILASTVSFRDGVVTDAAGISHAGGEATVSLGAPPSGRFPLNEGTNGVDTNSERREGGFYDARWSGEVNGIQSLNAVCEEQRSGDHDFFWTVGAGYTFEEQV